MDETKEIESKALALPEKAKLIRVENNEAMEFADRTVQDLSSMMKEVDAVFEPLASKAFAAHRAITGKWKEIKQPLEDAKTYLVTQVKNYQRKVKEAAEAEARRLADIAREEEEERRLAEAEQAEKAGDHEEAQAIIEEPIVIVPPVVKVEAPKVDGRKYMVKERAKVTDKMAVIKTVAMNPALQDLLDVNQSVANQKAKSLGKALNSTIPGLEYYEK